MIPPSPESVTVSFVIPARNEEFVLKETLRSIQVAAESLQVSFEVVVVDDASTDQTADIARAMGARVVAVELHNIGAVRNAGAAVAQGRILFFLDADTLLPPRTLAAALKALEQGAIGGGATVKLEAGITRRQQFMATMFTLYWQRLRKWAAGCNIFVLRSVFELVGGFDTQYFAAEERYLSDALKRQGRFVILREPVITSARKLRIYSSGHLIKVAVEALVLKRIRLTSPVGLEFLYDAPRETRDSQTNSPE